MIVLGIETSCDETACALVQEDGRILAHKVRSQLEEHHQFGGVVPEVAARAHLHFLAPLVQACLEEAGLDWNAVSAVAATTGPGLIGGVMVGATFAKGLSFARKIPFIAINHLEAHALTARLSADIPFPFLLLLASGGHCQILLAEGVGNYTQLGTTIDDAVGEAFDKTAKMLKLGYPGGPALEKRAREGKATRFTLPQPLCQIPGCDFSFSGLKTAVRQLIEKQSPLTAQDIADICATFQETVSAILVNRLSHAIEKCDGEAVLLQHLVVAGGVAANQAVRQALKGLAIKKGLIFVAPPLELCTDNGAMIAWAGIERLKRGHTDPLTTPSRPRWPLNTLKSLEEKIW